MIAAARDNEIILFDLFRAETFVKERKGPEEKHRADWPVVNVTCQTHSFQLLIGKFPSVLLRRRIKCSSLNNYATAREWSFCLFFLLMFTKHQQIAAISTFMQQL